MSGDTIVAEVDNHLEGGISVYDPIALEMAQESGAYSLISYMWVPLQPKNKIRSFIKDEHIITQIPLSEDLRKYYQRSLAMLKGDVEEMRRLLAEERPEMLDFLGEDEYNDEDDNLIKFPSRQTANTVH